jgi:RimJ/RimL family protein N-acetyltransferase
MADAKKEPRMRERQTTRLRLRRFREEDKPAFAAINADPAVARYLPSTLTRSESDAVVDRIVAHVEAHGFGLWAVDELASCELIGFVGLARPRFEADFTPCVEVGWRLRAASWGRGYATEAARAALHEGFMELGLQEIVSFTVPTNVPSRRVMEKLGMTPDREFEHPVLAEGHPLRRHVLYRLARGRYHELSATR